MSIHIRQEQSTDYSQVFSVIEQAFRDIPNSDQSEPYLVERLRVSDAFVPELSLVAVEGEKVVGHILLTKIQIQGEEQFFPSLALAPVSVLPSHQRKGIGGQLIRKAHEIAKQMEFPSIVLLGHAAYYPRFGYELCSKYGIELPFEVPEENCMVIALREGGLEGVDGKVVYPAAFFE